MNFTFRKKVFVLGKEFQCRALYHLKLMFGDLLILEGLPGSDLSEDMGSLPTQLHLLGQHQGCDPGKDLPVAERQ